MLFGPATNSPGQVSCRPLQPYLKAGSCQHQQLHAYRHNRYRYVGPHSCHMLGRQGVQMDTVAVTHQWLTKACYPAALKLGASCISPTAVQHDSDRVTQSPSECPCGGRLCSLLKSAKGVIISSSTDTCPGAHALCTSCLLCSSPGHPPSGAVCFSVPWEAPACTLRMVLQAQTSRSDYISTRCLMQELA